MNSMQNQGHATESYVPNMVHDTENTVSVFHTCLNVLNAISGIGILSLPYTLACGGWSCLALLFVIATVTFYTSVLIKRCMDMNGNIRTYPDVGEFAFGKKGRLIISGLMYTELYIVSVGFLILEGDNLNNLFPTVEIQIIGVAIGGKKLFFILVALIILPTVWLENLSVLSYVSATGVFASAVILLSVSWTGTFDGVGFHQKGTLFNWNGIPTAVSLYAFCYCAHPVFPIFYNSMRNKRQFSTVTLNLPTNRVSSKVAIYTTLVNPISKFALMKTPITDALKDLLPRRYKNRMTRAAISTVLVFSITVVALTLPFFGYLMSLSGAFLSATASIMFPCLCYLKVSGTYRKVGCEMVTILIIITAAITMGITGTYTSLMNIIKARSKF